MYIHISISNISAKIPNNLNASKAPFCEQKRFLKKKPEALFLDVGIAMGANGSLDRSYSNFYQHIIRYTVSIKNLRYKYLNIGSHVRFPVGVSCHPWLRPKIGPQRSNSCDTVSK